MQKQLTKIGKIPFTLLVPQTIEEFDQCHGRAGAVLDKAINYDVAHTILGKIRSKTGDALVKLGATRDIEKTNDDGSVVFKPIDTKWIDRQFVKLEMDAKAQADLYQSIADEIGYDVSGSRSSNKEFNQVDLKDAKQILEAIKLGKSTVERVVGNLQNRNPGLEITLEEDGTVTAENLAAGLKVERARIEAERQASLL
jgi:hypothetical protein